MRVEGSPERGRREKIKREAAGLGMERKKQNGVAGKHLYASLNASGADRGIERSSVSRQGPT